ncbi:MAG: head completion/stabilization protein [Cycloclasticus sp.]|jgi:Phage head completion protein (GPL).
MSEFGLKKVSESIETLQNNGFFPDVSIADFQNQFYQVSGVDNDKVKYQLIQSIIEINTRLKTLKEKTELTTLAETDNETVAGKNVLESVYFRAVFSHAKAKLLPIIVDVMTKDKADSLESNREQLMNEYMGTSNQAIRTLLGLKSATVELI